MNSFFDARLVQNYTRKVQRRQHMILILLIHHTFCSDDWFLLDPVIDHSSNKIVLILVWILHIFALSFLSNNIWHSAYGRLTNSFHRQAPTQPSSSTLAVNTSLNSTLQIYWQLLKNIYYPTSSPSGHPACNLPTRLLDHLSKPQAFLLPLFFLSSSPPFTFWKEGCVCVMYCMCMCVCERERERDRERGRVGERERERERERE